MKPFLASDHHAEVYFSKYSLLLVSGCSENSAAYIRIKPKEGQTPEQIFDNLGLTEYIEKITPQYQDTYAIALNVKLSDILQISRDLIESKLCVKAMPVFLSGIQTYK